MPRLFDLMILPAPCDFAALWKSLQMQTERSFRVFIPETVGAAPDDSRYEKLAVSSSIAAGDMLRAFFERADARWLGLLPTTVELAPHTLARIDRMLRNRGDCGWAFTDYELVEGGTAHRVELLEDLGDITEREDRGPCVWISRAALLAVGGIRSGLKYAPCYDLRLRLGERFRTLHIAEPLVRQYPAAPEMSEEEQRRAAKLYFPGQGKLGGFTYLFLDAAEEDEIESVFYDSLKRRGAWLEGDDGIVECPLDKSWRPGCPVVSVVIPVYNRARFIPTAIQSVLQSKFEQFEVIVIDNASTDNTVETVEHYVNSDPRVRLLRRERNIIGEALNDGVYAARGKYIAQLDSDDFYPPATLARAVAALDADPTAGVAISYYDLVDENAEAMPEFGVITHSRYNRNNILRRDGAGAARIWRRSVLLEFGGFDETGFSNYGEDYDMILKCSEQFRVIRLPEVLYHYRRHPDNTDVLRHHSLKIWSKTEARQRALIRRRHLNETALQS